MVTLDRITFQPDIQYQFLVDNHSAIKCSPGNNSFDKIILASNYIFMTLILYLRCFYIILKTDNADL